MAVIAITAVLFFDVLICIIEIPKMLREKLTGELIFFCFLLLMGTVLTVMKGLDIKIPNPSDLLAWIYSPVKGIMEKMLMI